MQTIKICYMLIFGISAFLILLVSLFSKKMLKTLFINASLGIFAFIVINLTAVFTGVHIAVNVWSVGMGSVFGLPAVFGLLIANLIF